VQKRFKELENRCAGSDKAATTLRQTLAQAQQRSVEWEQRTKEVEGRLEYTRTMLEQAEQTQTQLEADLSLAKLQLDEREAEDRLVKDREAKMRQHITELEAKMIRLQTELEKTKTPKLTHATVATIAPSPFRTNGATTRPHSRASTIYDMRSPTPNQRPASQESFNSGTPPSSASVWNSMHAPRQPYPTPGWSSNQSKKYPYLPSTPQGQHVQQYSRPAAPSPTPSTVSIALTQGKDGWYS